MINSTVFATDLVRNPDQVRSAKSCKTGCRLGQYLEGLVIGETARSFYAQPGLSLTPGQTGQSIYQSKTRTDHCILCVEVAFDCSSEGSIYIIHHNTREKNKNSPSNSLQPYHLPEKSVRHHTTRIILLCNSFVQCDTCNVIRIRLVLTCCKRGGHDLAPVPPTLDKVRRDKTQTDKRSNEFRTLYLLMVCSEIAVTMS
jgi:hypothetical protein